MRYTQVSAGAGHTILLRSDGLAVARGADFYCSIPTPEQGVTYTQVSAGIFHSVLLRSDGTAIARGDNRLGQCSLPSLRTWAETLTFSQAKTRWYVLDASFEEQMHEGVRLLQLSCTSVGNHRVAFTCITLSGEEACTVALYDNDYVACLPNRIAEELGFTTNRSLRLVLADGKLVETLPSSMKVRQLYDRVRHICDSSCQAPVPAG